MTFSISIPDQHKKFSVKPGTRLLDILQQHHQDVAAPCGGKGTCQKCQVQVDRLGQVLACELVLDEALWQRLDLATDEPLVVHLPLQARLSLTADNVIPQAELNPLVCRGVVQLATASLDDPRPDDQRFEEATGSHVALPLLNTLARKTSVPGQPVHFDFRTDTLEVLRFVEAADTPLLGCAVDLGTTTLAAYLFDLTTGEKLAQASRLNPQKSFGADVISRIEYAAGSAEQLGRLQAVIVEGLNGLIRELLGHAQGGTQSDTPGSAPGDALGDALGEHNRQSYRAEDVQVITLAGNTTMMHLVSGLNPERIGSAPFIPVSLSGKILPAAAIGLSFSPMTLAVLLPSIASYVGADITAGILACDLQRTGKSGQPGPNRVLLDIGTNGEIALAGPAGLVACATAAGPAFEGAMVTCGMPALPGALDQASFDDREIRVSVIGQGKMTGICGSGLVALVASCLDAGLIDETGRIMDEDELDDTVLPSLKAALGTVGGQKVIFADILPRRPGQSQGQTPGRERIYLSQKDIRELQNAKAAIAAGLQSLFNLSGLKVEQVSELDLAGGFGNYLDVEQAIRIGLIPEDFRAKVRTVGNSSGLGACLCLLDDRKRLETAKIARQVRYLELSGNPGFSDLYIDAMVFPE